MRQIIDLFRKTPPLDLANPTADEIVKASADILATEGEAALTTKRVAEKAGFSLGKVYQFVRSKDALIDALAQHELAHVRAELKAALAESHQQDSEGVVRSLIHVLLNRLTSADRARRAVAIMVIRRGDQGQLLKIYTELVTGVFDELRWHADFPDDMTVMRFHILTRAVFGAVRMTALENADLLSDPAFEPELARLALRAMRSGD